MQPGAQTQTILIVDDEPTVLQVCGRILTNAGFKVLTASGGLAALRLCEETKAQISLALIDVMMPEMTGPQLAGFLEKLNPRIVIMLMSGFPKNDLPKLLGHDVPKKYRFFEKPFQADRLTQSVSEAIAPPSARKAARR